VGKNVNKLKGFEPKRRSAARDSDLSRASRGLRPNLRFESDNLSALSKQKGRVLHAPFLNSMIENDQ
jgi:hypothetical protein